MATNGLTCYNEVRLGDGYTALLSLITLSENINRATGAAKPLHGSLQVWAAKLKEMGVRLLVSGANLYQLLWHQDPMSTFLAIRNCQFNSPALRICCNGRRTGRVRNLSGRLATALPAALSK